MAHYNQQQIYPSPTPVCNIPPIKECVFNTQGSIHCKGYATQGADKKEELKPQFERTQNDRLFQRVLDEKFTWR
jgi:hypothetical protein